MRHLFAYSKGENLDPETGISHLAHAGCCILFLIDHVMLGYGQDDRYSSEVKIPTPPATEALKGAREEFRAMVNEEVKLDKYYKDSVNDHVYRRFTGRQDV